MSSTTDQYDHAINLVDATAPPPTAPLDREATAESPIVAEPTRTTTGSSVGTNVAKSGSILRKEWARRKYARYQEERYAESDEASHAEGDSDAGQGKSTGKHRDSRQGRLRDKAPFRSKKQKPVKKDEVYHIDILYEHQRGAFFCGIPLYSSASLLNFDPSPWQTADFTDSPVDITNAQVPDPTWQWAWKRWYVDMSHDVDEEGWEYSLSFNANFTWHGTHPWLYSFARRRRWLRKRVKIQASGSHAHGHCLNAPMTEAHKLNDDYFTIHASRREASRESGSDRGSSRNRSSWIGSVAEHDTDDENEEILNVPGLLKRLRRTTIDRKKLLFFRKFLSNAGDEVVFLPEALDEIMNLFMYQSSRRQAISDLESAADALQASMGPQDQPRKPSPAPRSSRHSSRSSRSANRGENKAKQLEALRTAIDSVSDTTRELEYWSDVKELTSPVEGLDFTTSKTLVVPVIKIGNRVRGEADEEDVANTVSPIRVRTGIGARIKGIPKEAGLDEEVGLHARLGARREEQEQEQDSD